VYFLRPVVPALGELVDTSWTFLAGALLVAVIGIAIGGIHLSFHGSTAQTIRKSVGVGLTVVGAAAALNWILTPKLVPGWREKCAAEATAEQQKASRCWRDEAEILAEAKAAKAPVLIDFGASWCVPCKQYETNVFADPAVHAEIEKRYVAVKFDMSEQTDGDLDTMQRWKAGLPTVILLASDGTEVKRFHEPIPSAAEFLSALKSVQ
jgi:thiol:disulfide interchange protein DsbD